MPVLRRKSWWTPLRTTSSRATIRRPAEKKTTRKLATATAVDRERHFITIGARMVEPPNGLRAHLPSGQPITARLTDLETRRVHCSLTTVIEPGSLSLSRAHFRRQLPSNCAQETTTNTTQTWSTLNVAVAGAPVPRGSTRPIQSPTTLTLSVSLVGRNRRAQPDRPDGVVDEQVTLTPSTARTRAHARRSAPKIDRPVDLWSQQQQQQW
uniref:Uncharacterized protein n=1 Tax=Plectus sambesii TaxID=2011161 RepID=A0A914WTI2_9BILA